MKATTRPRKSGYIGQVLARIRRRARIKQETIAAELRITQASYSRIESGQAAITVDRLVEVSALLGTTPAEVLRLAVLESELENKLTLATAAG